MLSVYILVVIQIWWITAPHISHRISFVSLSI